MSSGNITFAGLLSSAVIVVIGYAIIFAILYIIDRLTLFALQIGDSLKLYKDVEQYSSVDG